MAAPTVPTSLPGVIAPQAPAQAAPSTLDGARAAMLAQGGAPSAAPGGVPTFATQLASMRGGAPPVAPQAPQQAQQAQQPPGVVPIAAHPQFRLYSHEELKPAAPTAPASALAAPAPQPVDPAMLALIMGVNQSNARVASALDRLTTPAPQAPVAPPDPGPMPNAMLEPDKFAKWLETRDARMAFSLEQRLKPAQPQVDEHQRQEAQRAEQEFRTVTTPLFNSLFTQYPGLVQVDRAALSAVVNSTATEMGLNSMDALRLLAVSPQQQQAVFLRIASRLGIAGGAQSPLQHGAAPAVQPHIPAHAGGFMGAPPQAYAPPPPQPVWNGQAWVLPQTVDRTFGVSGGSMLPVAAEAPAAAPQIPTLGAQIAEVQRYAGIYGR